MLETLFRILSIDAPSPEIALIFDEHGNPGDELTLDWPSLTVDITPTGTVSWARLEPREHGTDLERLLEIIQELPHD